KIGGDDPKVTVLPVQFASNDTGPVNIPLFRVQDKNTGKDRYVDNAGRSYDDFNDWKNNNQLPSGNMTFPKDGHLTSDAKLDSQDTPADSFSNKLKAGLDNAALVGGTLAAGAVLLGSGGILA